MEISKHIPPIRETDLIQHYYQEKKLAASSVLYELINSDGIISDNSLDSTWLKRFTNKLLSHDNLIPRFFNTIYTYLSTFKDRRVYELRQLINRNDIKFVQAAYSAILNRDPDEVGLKNCLSQLRFNQANKIGILIAMMQSAEARQQAVKIKGLSKYILLQRFLNARLIGGLLKYWFYLFQWLDTAIANYDLESKIYQDKIQINEKLESMHSETAKALFNLKRDINLISAKSISKEGVRSCIAMEQLPLSYALKSLSKRISCLDKNIGDLFERYEDTTQLIQSYQSKVDIQFKNVDKQITNEKDALLKKCESISQILGVTLSEVESQFKKTGENYVKLAEEMNALSEQCEVINQKVELQQSEVGKNFKKVDTHYANLTSVTDKLSNKYDAMNRQATLYNSEVDNKINQLGTQQQFYQQQFNNQLESLQLPFLFKQEDACINQLLINHADKFRGSYDEIKDRLKVYLPYLHQNKVLSNRYPILEIGSGRGEWLALMQEHNFTAQGVEVNPILVEESRRANLDVVHAEGIEFMQNLEAESVGMVVSFHVIEHLPPNHVFAFIRQCLRIVKTGGLVILETPNPENVSVGSCNFYLDPTHCTPLPPALMHFYFTELGFKQVNVIRLHPASGVESSGEAVNNETRWLSDFFLAAQDYAIIAQK